MTVTLITEQRNNGYSTHPPWRMRSSNVCSFTIEPRRAHTVGLWTQQFTWRGASCYARAVSEPAISLGSSGDSVLALEAFVPGVEVHFPRVTLTQVPTPVRPLDRL